MSVQFLFKNSNLVTIRYVQTLACVAGGILRANKQLFIHTRRRVKRASTGNTRKFLEALNIKNPDALLRNEDPQVGVCFAAKRLWWHSQAE